MASNGKYIYIFFSFFKPGEYVRAEVHFKVLRYKVLQLLKLNYPNGNYVWVQEVLLFILQMRCRNFANPIFQFFGVPNSGLRPAQT